jgi:hypothetical protein
MPAAAKEPRVITFPRPHAQPLRRRRPGATPGAIEARLTMLSRLAPTGALSVLVVTLDPDIGDEGRREVEAVVRQQTRPTDYAAPISASQVGVVLQGAAALRAAAVSARIGAALRRSGVVRPGAVMVSAATGTGRNGITLLLAATSWLPDCG